MADCLGLVCPLLNISHKKLWAPTHLIVITALPNIMREYKFSFTRWTILFLRGRDVGQLPQKKFLHRKSGEKIVHNEPMGKNSNKLLLGSFVWLKKNYCRELEKLLSKVKVKRKTFLLRNITQTPSKIKWSVPTITSFPVFKSCESYST